MSAENGGPRVWNRGDVEAVMHFLGHGLWAPKVVRLMEYIENFEGRPVAARRIPKLAAALGDSEKSQPSAVAAMGGHARAAALSPERRSEIAKKAAEKRWEGNTDVDPRFGPNT